MAKEIIIASVNEVTTGVDQFTTGLLRYLDELGLPKDQVLVSIAERKRVINNERKSSPNAQAGRRERQRNRACFARSTVCGLREAGLVQPDPPSSHLRPATGTRTWIHSAATVQGWRARALRRRTQ